MKGAIGPAEYRAFLRVDLTAFIERTFYLLNPEAKFVAEPFIGLIAAELEAVRRGEIRRLILNMPPRSLKSHAVSVAFIAWLLGHDPTKEIIAVSYSQDLADDLARKTRAIMLSALYQQIFATRLGDRNAVHDFETTAHGRRYATSVGGPLTGRGGDIIIIDDPLKGSDALSEPARRALIDWYRNTLISRLNDKRTGAIVIVTQRVHVEDLVGFVLEDSAE